MSLFNHSLQCAVSQNCFWKENSPNTLLCNLDKMVRVFKDPICISAIILLSALHSHCFPCCAARGLFGGLRKIIAV